ncbi:MAG: AAA family ATPase [Candidatus Komeilibacteria bacterium]|nr:AAA family ATPase [Candidatus Komeilibacteria bacterium]
MKNVNLKHYAAAGYPAVCVQSSDEDRVISSVLAAFPKRVVMRIATAGGLTNARDNSVIDDKASYPAGFARACSMPNSVVIVLDYQHFIKQPGPYRVLRDFLPRVKQANSMLVFVAPSWSLPAELEHDVPIMHDSLPTRDELSAALKTCTDSTGAKIGNTSALLDAASGLTLAEAESAFALSYAVSGDFDHTRVSDEKMKLVRQSGLAEIINPAPLDSFGGYQVAVDTIKNEIIPSMDDREIATSGMICDGVPGTGKTHLARVLGSLLGWPMLYVSLARLKGQYVGQSEGNVASIFRLARAIQPVILLFDELEKGLAGSASNGDSGVSKGIEGIFLTETQSMRDNGDRIFIVATTNDYQMLPAPVTRRLEIKFFHDVPTIGERTEIADKKLRKYAPDSVKLAAKIASLTDEWTGAEIEDLIRTAARRTPKNESGKRVISETTVIDASHDIKPIAKTRAEEIRRLRDWGRANLRLANSPADIQPTKPTRKLSVIDSDTAGKISSGNA